MATDASKPEPIQWVPFGFAILAAVIAIVGYIFPGDDAARQGIYNIALSLASSAGGIYAASHAANRSTATSISAAAPPTTPPNNPHEGEP